MLTEGTETSQTSSENIENFYYGDEKKKLFYIETRENYKIVGITICDRLGRCTRTYTPQKKGNFLTHPFYMEEEIYRFSELDEDEMQIGMVIFNRSGEELFFYRTETPGNFIRIDGGGKVYSITEYDQDGIVVNVIAVNLPQDYDE